MLPLNFEPIARIWSVAAMLPPASIRLDDSVPPQVLPHVQTKVLFTKVVAYDIVPPGTNSRADAEQCHSATKMS